MQNQLHLGLIRYCVFSKKKCWWLWREPVLVTRTSGTVSSPKKCLWLWKEPVFFHLFQNNHEHYIHTTTTTNVNCNAIETTKCPSKLLKLQNVHLGCYRNYKNVHLGYIHTSSNSSNSSITNVLHSSNSTNRNSRKERWVVEQIPRSTLLAIMFLGELRVVPTRFQNIKDAADVALDLGTFSSLSW